MKTKQINAILVDQPKRRRKIALYVCVIFVVCFFALTSFFLFMNNNKTYYVSYHEDSNVDYKVFLKENNFFSNNYLGSNNQYIASIIDYITADFDYQLNVDSDNIDYKYKYRIESVVEVIEENTKNSLYHVTDDLVKEKILYAENQSFVTISESINIDYNQYNDLIKKFINIYDLEDVESNLIINMYVDVLGECEDLEDGSTNSVVSLTIPLTTKTIAIDIGYDLLDEGNESFMACKKADSIYYIYLVITIIFSLIAILLIISLVKYVIITRTAETIYERELKKILNNYKSYIQKINNDFDLEGYQILKVDTFADMLEIRDTIQEPILMAENRIKTGVYFLIPSKTKILYLYGLKVSEIKKKMKKVS